MIILYNVIIYIFHITYYSTRIYYRINTSVMYNTMMYEQMYTILRYSCLKIMQNERTNERTDGRTDERTNELMNETNELIIYNLLTIFFIWQQFTNEFNYCLVNCSFIGINLLTPLTTRIQLNMYRTNLD